jgi:octopine oxidase subunit A
MCGNTVVETMAAPRGHPPAKSGCYRIRMPMKPITVGQIAGLQSNKGEAQP